MIASSSAASCRSLSSSVEAIRLAATMNSSHPRLSSDSSATIPMRAVNSVCFNFPIQSPDPILQSNPPIQSFNPIPQSNPQSNRPIQSPNPIPQSNPPV